MGEGRMERSREMDPGMGPFMAVALGVALLDQGVKVWIRTHLPLHETISIIPGLFDITHVANVGAAFGILAHAGPWRELFFQVVSVAAMLGLALYYYTAPRRDRLLFWSASLILGGALGNFIDRVTLGHVTDFLDFYVGTYHWPAFNVADSAITVGGLLLALRVFREADQETR